MFLGQMRSLRPAAPTYNSLINLIYVLHYMHIKIIIFSFPVRLMKVVPLCFYTTLHLHHLIRCWLPHGWYTWPFSHLHQLICGYLTPNKPGLPSSIRDLLTCAHLTPDLPGSNHTWPPHAWMNSNLPPPSHLCHFNNGPPVPPHTWPSYTCTI